MKEIELRSRSSHLALWVAGFSDDEWLSFDFAAVEDAERAVNAVPLLVRVQPSRLHDEPMIQIPLSDRRATLGYEAGADRDA